MIRFFGSAYGCMTIFLWALLGASNAKAQKWPHDECMGLFDCQSSKKTNSSGKSSQKKSFSHSIERAKTDPSPERILPASSKSFVQVKVAMDLFGPFTYETFDYSSLRDEQRYSPLLRTVLGSVGALFYSSQLSHGPEVSFRFAETYENEISRFAQDETLSYKELIKVSGSSFGLGYSIGLPNFKESFWDPQISLLIERPLIKIRSQRLNDQISPSQASLDSDVHVAGILGTFRLSSGWWFEWKALDAGVGMHAYVPFMLQVSHDSENQEEEDLKDRLNLRRSRGLGFWIAAGW